MMIISQRSEFQYIIPPAVREQNLIGALANEHVGQIM